MPLGVMTPLTEEAANSRRNSYGMHRISLPKLLRTAWCHFLVSCSSLQVRFLYSTLCSLLCNHRAHICGSHFSLTISSVVWIYDVPHRLVFWTLALQQVALLLEDCGAFRRWILTGTSRSQRVGFWRPRPALDVGHILSASWLIMK